MTAALAALVALSLLLAAAFDFPFSGDVKVLAEVFAFGARIRSSGRMSVKFAF
jgi:hypothetical protein